MISEGKAVSMGEEEEGSETELERASQRFSKDHGSSWYRGRENGWAQKPNPCVITWSQGPEQGPLSLIASS